MDVLFAFGFAPGPMEMIIILLIAVLLFGKRLPEVGRSLGKGLVEFKKGIRGIEDEVQSPGSSAAVQQPAHEEVDDRDEARLALAMHRDGRAQAPRRPRPARTHARA